MSGGRRAAAAGLAALTSAVALTACGIEDREPRIPGSTLRSTAIDRDGDADLERGPGELLLDRTDLAPRGTARREVARFAQVADLHVRDEESPARVPFLDRLGPPVTSTFRPQEALSTQVLVATVRALNLERPAAVLLTGDLTDNAQRNEVDQLFQALQGGRVRPDSGVGGTPESYRGVQQATSPDGFFYRPDVDAPRVRGMVRRAQREYFSPGLRAPWFAALGNHDILVQGELPPSREIDAVATGPSALFEFDPRLRDLVRDLPERADSPDLRGVPVKDIEAAITRLPGRRTTVSADPARATVDVTDLVRRLRPQRSDARERLDYAVDLVPGVRTIVLDTANRGGGAAGVLRAEQVGFLRRELRRTPENASIVIVTHHGLARTKGGGAAERLLARDDRVIAELAGHNHRHEIRPRRTRAGGYWEIHTASLADWPQQSRMLRLVTGDRGERALETWVVDHAGGLDTDDLAGSARVLSFVDAQGGRPRGFRGRHRDRNARLWLPPRRR